MTENLRQRPGDQPLPTGGEENVQDALIAHIERRKALGLQRYGQPVKTFNGRDAVQDLMDELLDGATYAMQVRMEIAATQDRIGRALTVHVADETGRCVSCLQSSPCETRQILTGQQARPITVTRTDPVQEVVCSPDAIEYVRTHFQITAVEDERCIPPAPLGQYLGFPVYVDDALPPRTVRLQPHDPKQ